MGTGGETHLVRAPVRIDLAGGTLDIWPICLLEPGAATVNLAIDRLVRAEVGVRRDGEFRFRAADRGVSERHRSLSGMVAESRLPLHREVAALVAPHLGRGGGLDVRTHSGVPAGSGLGGSSTLLVALLTAAQRATGRRLPRERFLRTVMDLEARIIGVPTGAQDYLPAIQGGLGVVTYPPGGPVRSRVSCDADAVARRIVLVYTGEPHVSATNNWEITKAYLDGDADVRGHLRDIAAATADLHAALAGGDLDAAGDALGREWAARKLLAPGVSTRGIERLGLAARGAGARSMKVCGAGGGGCVVLWCDSGTRSRVERAARDLGHRLIRFHVAKEGVR